MKTIFVLLLTFFTLSAFAGNEGPQATPAPIKHSKLLAESVVGIMFAPANYPRMIRYQIFSNGYTQALKTMRDGKEVVTVLKPFSAEEMRAIKANIKDIVPGKLFDPNPGMPGCMDAPSQVLKVYSAKEEIQISSRRACKTYVRKEANQADADMIKILNDLSHSE